jgi:hypothetical protein
MMAKGGIDFTPIFFLVAMTVGVVLLKMLTQQGGAGGITAKIDKFISDIFSSLNVSATPAPAPAPSTPAPSTPAPSTTPAPATGGGGCDCTCMPMDSDPNRQKIETAAGEDCYNHIYPASVAECETALKEVCAKRGGGTTTASPTYGGPGSVDEGNDSELGGAGSKEDKDNDKKKKGNVARIIRLANA